MFSQDTIGKQDELGLAATHIRLELIAEFATRHGAHILLTHHNISIEGVDIGQGVLHIIVDVEVVNLMQVCIHEGEELAVVVDEYNTELLRQFVNLKSLDVCGHIAGAHGCQGYLTTIIQFETVLSARLCLLLRILEGALHFRDASDNLQHLEVERVQLLLALHRGFAFGHIADNGRHTSHRLSKFVAGELDFLTLAHQLVNHGLLASPDSLELLDTITPDSDDDNQDDDINGEHPPRQPPRTIHNDLQGALLIADSTIGTDSLYVKGVGATAQFMELYTMQEGITIAPVIVETFHPIHELEALALVVVTSTKLDSEGALVVVQLYLIALVEGLWQNDVTVILHTRQDFLLTDKELGQHNARQRFLLIFISMTYPVDTIESAKEHFTILLGEDGTHIELVALQTVTDVVVVESVGERGIFVVTLYNHTTDTIAGRNPDAMVLVFCNTTDGVVAESVFLCDIAQLVVVGVEDVDTLTRAYPQQTTRVFENLGDIVVGEG